MDVLYILGNGSIWNNNEIKYSLRSLQKYGQNYDRVFVTGIKPDFLNGHIVYNYHADNYAPNINHFLKVLWTFKNTDISDDILLNYDDNFFIEQVDIEKYPFYYKRQAIPDKFPVSNLHTRSLINTRKILLEMGREIKDFAVHCPVIYNRQRFYEFAEQFRSHIDIKNKNVSISIRSAYLNYIGTKGQYLSDVKIRRIMPKKLIEDTIRGRNIFSINNNITRGGIVDFMTENYPNKSKWEL